MMGIIILALLVYTVWGSTRRIIEEKKYFENG